MYTPIYRITNKLLKNIAGIEAAKEIIVHAPLIPLWERNFQQEALARTVHYSTQIEGNEISLSEAHDIIEEQYYKGEEISSSLREVINYREVMEYIAMIYAKNEKHREIREEVLLNVHKYITQGLVSSDQSGRFRQVNVKVINSKTGEVGLFPPHFMQIKQLVGELLSWLNDSRNQDISIIIKAGILHYRLTAIHPFTEGNGRTARAMATLYLFFYGYDIRKFFCLDEYYAKDAVSYYSFLNKTDKTGDITEWLEYFSEGLMCELDLVKNKILNISKDVRIRKTYGQIGLNERQLRILNYIEEHGSIANKDWRILFPQLSDDTILRDINKLLSTEIIFKRGSTKSAVYVLA